MTKEKHIIPGTNDPVTIIVTGYNLMQAQDIICTFGEDQRTLLLNPDDVQRSIDPENSEQYLLQLYFNDTTETENQYWKIVAIDLDNPDGITITRQCLGNLDKTKVC